jgi:glyoxylase-like metal-dependent hydrolase (beta-lactamase superfamily II)
MESANYHFTIGSFKCVAVSDGTMTYAPPMFPPPCSFLFANAAGQEAGQLLAEHGIDIAQWKEWVSSYTCLLIDTGNQLVLVDTGAGNLAPTTGRLLENLRQEDVAPQDIGIVILSHGHPDHLGGNLNSEGNPTFAKARYTISKNEWLFWTSGQAEKRLGEHGQMLISIARKNLLPFQGSIHLVDRETEIVPGLRAVFAPGHTPGLMALSVASEGDRLLYTSDVVIHPVHLQRPDWYCATDVASSDVILSRRRILDKAAFERSLVMSFHFPFPGLGHVTRKDLGWEWQPVGKR